MIKDRISQECRCERTSLWAEWGVVGRCTGKRSCSSLFPGYLERPEISQVHTARVGQRGVSDRGAWWAEYAGFGLFT